ncbi:formylglycine-generating enzyme family protein [Kibdelosporangium aridum]|uniref:formylglycine-generating enzyme family protein n=1 Tax=Kibdelosporangium aridum TaxID=2030 RepID=UPI000526D3D9
MIRIPGGRFIRGSEAAPDEQPTGEVEVSAFLMDEYPVTNADFFAFVEDGGYHQTFLWTPAGWQWRREQDIERPNYWSDPTWSRPDTPVTGVSWWEALAFARWAGKTLPTEAQWEYAAAGKSGNTYPWGDDEPDTGLANFAPYSDPPLDRQPTRADAFPRNTSEFGIRDMAGNFAEWCLDTYRVRYHDFGTDPIVIGDETEDHVVRGGCGLHDEDYLRCSARDHYHPGLRDNLVGFRCVRYAD